MGGAVVAIPSMRAQQSIWISRRVCCVYRFMKAGSEEETNLFRTRGSAFYISSSRICDSRNSVRLAGDADLLAAEGSDA